MFEAEQFEWGEAERDGEAESVLSEADRNGAGSGVAGSDNEQDLDLSWAT